MKTKIEDKDYQEMIETLSDWAGITVNKTFINLLIKKEPSLLGSWVGCGLDTCTREVFMEAMGQELAGETWPTFGEGRNGKFEKFFDKVKKEAIKRGFKVNE
jgi:hypothetical protein